MGGDTGIPPTLGSQPVDNGTAIAQQVQGNGSASNPIQLPPQSSDNMTGAAAPTNSGTRQSAWMNVVKGALFGMMAGAGTKNIGTGMSAGLEKVNSTQQQDIQNQVQQQQLKFESIRAADSHINALDEHTRAMQLSRYGDLEYAQKSAEYQNFLQDNFGIEPDLSFNDNNTQAHAGLQNLAQANGGQIPPVSTVLQPSGKGWGSGQVAVYSPSQQQMKQNANGYRDLINTSRRVQGLPDIDDATFNSMGFKGQRDAAQKAIDSLKPTPAFDLNKSSIQYLPVVLAQKQQQLEQYQHHRDVNGKLDADPNVERMLQNGITYLQTAWDSSNKMENQAQVENINATAGPKAEAERKAELAKQNTPQGRATLAKTVQETLDAKYRNIDKGTQMLWDNGVNPATKEKLTVDNAPDEMLVDPRTGNPIPMKMLPTLKPSTSEVNRAQFANSVLHTLDAVDKARAAGKLPNGPLTGPVVKTLSKYGLAGEDSQSAIDLISLAQSAATGAHVAGRFSVQVMQKMNELLKLNMNDSQFAGAESAIRSVMDQYSRQNGRYTVGEWKNEMTPQDKANVMGLSRSDAQAKENKVLPPAGSGNKPPGWLVPSH
jgi:hypothetical protein